MYAEGQAMLTYIDSIETYGRTVVVIKDNQKWLDEELGSFCCENCRKKLFSTYFPLNNSTTILSM